MLKKYILLPVLLTLLAAGCEDFLDVNENPNVATQPPLNGLLASSTYQTGHNYFRVSNFTSYFVQYLASPNPGSSTDTYDQADYSSAWGNLYNVMTDLYDLIRFGREQNAFHHLGAARILMAMNLGLVADAWGDAPYSDAFTGETLTPTYDTGQQIYDQILTLLDQGLNDLADPANAVALDAGSDFLHGGDLAAWMRTAHGLKARYLNHLTKTDAYNPQAVLAEVDQAYTGNEHDAQITTFEVRNPWSQVAINNDNLLLDGWLSDQFVTALNGDTYGVFDPRLPLITEPLPDSSFVGTVNGDGRRGDGTVQEETYLETTGAYSMEDSPLLVLTYAELKFIEAEAAFRAGDRQRALDAFLEGIRANMAKVGVTEDAANKYFEETYPDLTAESLTLDDIFREKYAALFLHPETWVDARRHDYQYEDFELPVGALLPEFIRRVQYPGTELDRNQANTPVINSLAERLFWDE